MANNHDLWRMDVCMRAEKALRNVGGWGCLVKNRTLSCKCSFQTSIGNFKLGIFRFTVCTGTFFCSKRFVYKKQHKPWLAKTFQNCLQTVSTNSSLTYFFKKYLHANKNGTKVCIHCCFHTGNPWRICQSSSLQVSEDKPPNTLGSVLPNRLRNTIASSTAARIEATNTWRIGIHSRWIGGSGQRHTQRHSSECGVWRS